MWIKKKEERFLDEIKKKNRSDDDPWRVCVTYLGFLSWGCRLFGRENEKERDRERGWIRRMKLREDGFDNEKSLARLRV